jgi:hypothetical protein
MDETDGPKRPREVAKQGATDMGKLYQYCCRIQEHIEANDLDVFKTRGELALQTGFLITLVGPDDPDDPARASAASPATPPRSTNARRATTAR